VEPSGYEPFHIIGEAIKNARPVRVPKAVHVCLDSLLVGCHVKAFWLMLALRRA
jgi:hypothetical protein